MRILIGHSHAQDEFFKFLVSRAINTCDITNFNLRANFLNSFPIRKRGLLCSFFFRLRARDIDYVSIIASYIVATAGPIVSLRFAIVLKFVNQNIDYNKLDLSNIVRHLHICICRRISS